MAVAAVDLAEECLELGGAGGDLLWVEIWVRAVKVGIVGDELSMKDEDMESESLVELGL